MTYIIDLTLRKKIIYINYILNYAIWCDYYVVKKLLSQVYR